MVFNYNTKFCDSRNFRKGKIRVRRGYKPKETDIISSVRASILVEQGCLAYLAHAKDADIEAPSIGFIPMVCE